MLTASYFEPMGTASVWLPPHPHPLTPNPPPSFDDIKRIPTRLLSLPLDEFLFQQLPTMMNTPYEDIKWHFNALCQGCPFESECSERAARQGKLGSMMGISIQDAQILEDLIAMTGAQKKSQDLTDIECLDQIVRSERTMTNLRMSHPSIVKKAERILKIPTKRSTSRMYSPVVDAARTRNLQARRSFFPFYCRCDWLICDFR